MLGIQIGIVVQKTWCIFEKVILPSFLLGKQQLCNKTKAIFSITICHTILVDQFVFLFCLSLQQKWLFLHLQNPKAVAFTTYYSGLIFLWLAIFVAIQIYSSTRKKPSWTCKRIFLLSIHVTDGGWLSRTSSMPNSAPRYHLDKAQYFGLEFSLQPIYWIK